MFFFLLCNFRLYFFLLQLFSLRWTWFCCIFSFDPFFHLPLFCSCSFRHHLSNSFHILPAMGLSILNLFTEWSNSKLHVWVLHPWFSVQMIWTTDHSLAINTFKYAFEKLNFLKNILHLFFPLVFMICLWNNEELLVFTSSVMGLKNTLERIWLPSGSSKVAR